MNHAEFRPTHTRGIANEGSDLANVTSGQQRPTRSSRPLLNLTHDLTGFAQALHHLEALLPPPDRVVAFLQKVVELVGAVHVF